MYLGRKAVLVKSCARMHRSNLINVGILPLTFADENDYSTVKQGDELELTGVRAAIEAGRDEITVTNRTSGKTIRALCQLSDYEREVILAGGLLPHTRSKTV